MMGDAAVEEPWWTRMATNSIGESEGKAPVLQDHSRSLRLASPPQRLLGLGAACWSSAREEIASLACDALSTLELLDKPKRAKAALALSRAPPIGLPWPRHPKVLLSLATSLAEALVKISEDSHDHVLESCQRPLSLILAALKLPVSVSEERSLSRSSSSASTISIGSESNSSNSNGINHTTTTITVTTKSIINRTITKSATDNRHNDNNSNSLFNIDRRSNNNCYSKSSRSKIWLLVADIVREKPSLWRGSLAPSRESVLEACFNISAEGSCNAVELEETEAHAREVLLLASLLPGGHVLTSEDRLLIDRFLRELSPRGSKSQRAVLARNAVRHSHVLRQAILDHLRLCRVEMEWFGDISGVSGVCGCGGAASGCGRIPPYSRSVWQALLNELEIVGIPTWQLQGGRLRSLDVDQEELRRISSLPLHQLLQILRSDVAEKDGKIAATDMSSSLDESKPCAPQTKTAQGWEVVDSDKGSVIAVENGGGGSGAVGRSKGTLRTLAESLFNLRRPHRGVGGG
eukprot:TRINITY_DN37062_c0_g1_i1.p1 TRINITY_DN37062_c0_g1~~TRINITY_DN37062_c0_g1_i1.p1  ORF type:complete len:520 (-),score=81.67 TRINITY_DN37062_c0_g1_i1:16-1575(-)